MSKAKPLSLSSKQPPITPAPAAHAAQNAPAARPERPDRVDTRMIGAHFPTETWTAWHFLIAKTGKTSKELLAEAMSDLMAKYENAPR